MFRFNMPNLKSNFREKTIKEKYEKLGYEVLHKGWPDFLIFNDKDVIFLEVKRQQKFETKKSGMSKHQTKMHEILKRCGLKVLIERM